VHAARREVDDEPDDVTGKAAGPPSVRRHATW
jgi:hypothetical protein